MIKLLFVFSLSTGDVQYRVNYTDSYIRLGLTGTDTEYKDTIELRYSFAGFVTNKLSFELN